MDSTQLERMFDVIRDEQLGIHSVVVVRNGHIVAERYYPPYQADTKHQLYSVTKSFISALIGIAIAEGYIDGVDHRVLDFFPEHTFANLDARKQAMTLEHLLTMTSGLDWEEGMPIYQELSRASDWVQFVLDGPMVAEPGSEFNYCSGCSHLMSAIVQETTGTGTLEYAQDRLFEPLGINDFHWELDASGIPNGGWGLDLTPRDMAKFGYLYLNDGVWDGQQVVPTEWVTASVNDRIEFDDRWGYGYQWWIYPPFDAYSAVGLGAQLIVVIPDSELVVVFTAALSDNAALLELIESFIVPAVQSSHSFWHWHTAGIQKPVGEN
jgi:CubicO group peptidase (beta-lactamase class C family)